MEASARCAGAREVAATAKHRGDAGIESDATARAEVFGARAALAQDAKALFTNAGSASGMEGVNALTTTVLLCLSLSSKNTERWVRRVFASWLVLSRKRRRNKRLAPTLMARNAQILRRCYFARWIKYHGSLDEERAALAQGRSARDTYLNTLEENVREATATVSARKHRLQQHSAGYDAFLADPQFGQRATRLNPEEAAYRDSVVASYAEKERQLERELLIAQNELKETIDLYFAALERERNGGTSQPAVTSHRSASVAAPPPPPPLRHQTQPPPPPANYSVSRYSTAAPVSANRTTPVPVRTAVPVSSATSRSPLPIYAPPPMSPVVQPSRNLNSSPMVHPSGTREVELQHQLLVTNQELEETRMESRRYRDMLIQEQQQNSHLQHNSVDPYSTGQSRHRIIGARSSPIPMTQSPRRHSDPIQRLNYAE